MSRRIAVDKQTTFKDVLRSGSRVFVRCSDSLGFFLQNRVKYFALILPTFIFIEDYNNSY